MNKERWRKVKKYIAISSVCAFQLCVYLTIKLHAQKHRLTEIPTLQLLFFSLTSGMMEGFQVYEGLVVKTKRSSRALFWKWKCTQQ